jgi:hypothetical protein
VSILSPLTEVECKVDSLPTIIHLEEVSRHLQATCQSVNPVFGQGREIARLRAGEVSTQLAKIVRNSK